MPFDFVAYDAKCAQMGPDALQQEWEHYTRQIAGASTSTAVSGLAIPLTAGVSMIGVGLAAPTIHNARKKREIIERHLQRHGTTHHTRKRDVAGSMAFSGTLGVLTLGVGAVGHDAVMSAGAEHGVSSILNNETALKIGMHAALDGAAMATEEAHHAHKKEKASMKQKLKQQAQNFTITKPNAVQPNQPQMVYGAVPIPGTIGNTPQTVQTQPHYIQPPSVSVIPAPPQYLPQMQPVMQPPSSPMPQPFSPAPIYAPIPQHVPQQMAAGVAAYGVSPSPTPAPPPYTAGSQTPLIEKGQPIMGPYPGTPLPVYTPQSYTQQPPQSTADMPMEMPAQPVNVSQPPAPTHNMEQHQPQPAAQHIPPFTAYVAAPGFNPPIPTLLSTSARNQQSAQVFQTQNHAAASLQNHPLSPEPSMAAYTQAPTPQHQQYSNPLPDNQEKQPDIYFPPLPNSTNAQAASTSTPAPYIMQAPIHHVSRPQPQPIQANIAPAYGSSPQQQALPTPPPSQYAVPQFQRIQQAQAAQSYQPHQYADSQQMPQMTPMSDASSPYQTFNSGQPQQQQQYIQQQQPSVTSPPPQAYVPQYQTQPLQFQQQNPQQQPLMTPPYESQPQIPPYNPAQHQWQNNLPSPMPTPGYERMNHAWSQSPHQNAAPVYPGVAALAAYPNEKAQMTDPVDGLTTTYGNMRVA